MIGKVSVGRRNRSAAADETRVSPLRSGQGLQPVSKGVGGGGGQDQHLAGAGHADIQQTGLIALVPDGATQIPFSKVRNIPILPILLERGSGQP